MSVRKFRMKSNIYSADDIKFTLSLECQWIGKEKCTLLWRDHQCYILTYPFSDRTLTPYFERSPVGYWDNERFRSLAIHLSKTLV